MADPVEGAIIRLIRSQPFYGSLLINLKRVPTAAARDMVPTACVYARRDASIGLAVNEDFFSRLAAREQEAVLIHECLHVAHLHLERGPRELPNPELANIAMDLAINQFIEGLPEGALTLDMFKELKLEREQTTDYYYERLRKAVDKLKKQFGGGLPKPLDDHGRFGPGEAGEGDAKRDGRGAAKGKPSEDGAGDDQAGGLSPVLIEAACREALREAMQAAKAAQGWGPLPAGVQRAVEAALAAKVDWRRELRRFVGERIRVATTSTRKRPNRRFRWDFPGKKVVRGARLLVAVDTSGSIGQAELKQFLAEIDAIAQRATVVLAEVDAAVHDVYEYRPRRTSPALKGGGGTSFQVLWDELREGRKKHPALRESPDGIIYLTDGEAVGDPRLHGPLLDLRRRPPPQRLAVGATAAGEPARGRRVLALAGRHEADEGALRERASRLVPLRDASAVLASADGEDRLDEPLRGPIPARLAEVAVERRRRDDDSMTARPRSSLSKTPPSPGGRRAAGSGWRGAARSRGRRRTRGATSGGGSGRRPPPASRAPADPSPYATRTSFTRSGPRSPVCAMSMTRPVKNLWPVAASVKSGAGTRASFSSSSSFP